MVFFQMQLGSWREVRDLDLSGHRFSSSIPVAVVSWRQSERIDFIRIVGQWPLAWCSSGCSGVLDISERLQCWAQQVGWSSSRMQSHRWTSMNDFIDLSSNKLSVVVLALKDARSAVL